MTRESYGLRARLTWYARRLAGKPAVLRGGHAGGWFIAVADPKPAMRQPRQSSWEGWQQVGASDEVRLPPGFVPPSAAFRVPVPEGEGPRCNICAGVATRGHQTWCPTTEARDASG